MSKHLYDQGIIGNCTYIAHVNKNTNINWLCWPRFDSSFIFGGMLDEDKGGEFSIKPYGEIRESKQYYVENTNVLCTEITCEEGSYRITDYAPRFKKYERNFKPLMLIRKIEPLEGTPRIRVKCFPKGEYGRITPKMAQGSSHIKYLGLQEEVRLTTNISLSHILEEKYSVINEPKYLVLTYGSPLEAPLQSTCEDFLTNTINYWRNWVKSTSIGNFHQNIVIRSALALKIHQYEDTGAIIASSTMSLPESPGSGRNWDYRFCWMRDAYYTLAAFNNIGHFEEMQRYFHYIENITATTEERYQPLYTISGDAYIPESILDLDGYKGNKPVRLGNQASEHIQNDVYGQVLVALLPLFIDSRFIGSERIDNIALVNKILGKIEKTMDEKDASLWEFRDRSDFYGYTFLFQWAGCNAALKIAKMHGNEEMAKKAGALQQQAIEKIEACFIQDQGAYAQAVGSKHMDAAMLQLIMMNYLDPGSKLAKSHLAAIEKELKAKDGLFYRYRHEDDFGEPETTFFICAFWYVEALAAVGRVQEAINEFNSLIKYTNHLGLFSEDVDAETGSQWGNFPQAYSHVGLVNAAYRIASKLDLPNFI